MCEITIPSLFILTLRERAFTHYFENGTKVKRPCEINSPLDNTRNLKNKEKRIQTYHFLQDLCGRIRLELFGFR